MKYKKLKFFFLLFFICFIVALINSGTWLNKSDALVKSEAMVLLMGSIPDRVLQTYDVQKYADRIIIIKVTDPGNNILESRGIRILNKSEEVRDILVNLGINRNKIILLPGGSSSTIMEAEITQNYLSKHPEIKSLILVTSAHHTRRSYMIFKSVLSKLDKKVKIYCSPSKYSDFNASSWWKSKDDIQLVLSELIKISSFVFIEQWTI